MDCSAVVSWVISPDNTPVTGNSGVAIFKMFVFDDWVFTAFGYAARFNRLRKV